jgi:hypothetical protein
MPNLTVSWAQEVMPYKNDAVVTQFTDDLRKANLLE